MAGRSRSTSAFGFAAMAAGLLGLLYAPFHAAAYLATPDGDAPLLAWHGPFRDAFPWAFDFAGPDGVYLTYGRVAPFVLAGLLAGLWALGSTRRAVAGAFERRSFAALFAVHGLVVVGVAGEYYTPYLEESFLVAGPALLLTLIGYVAYGSALLRSRSLPKALPWSLIVAAVVVVPLVALLGHIPLALAGLYLAWIRIGRRLADGPGRDAIASGRRAPAEGRGTL